MVVVVVLVVVEGEDDGLVMVVVVVVVSVVVVVVILAWPTVQRRYTPKQNPQSTSDREHRPPSTPAPLRAITTIIP